MHQSQVSELASSSAWKELSLAFADERLSNACTEAFENCVLLLSGVWNDVCLQHSFKKAACLVHHSLCLLLKCQQLKEAVTISLCCLNIIVFADVVIHGCVTQKFHRVPTYGSNEIQIEDVNLLRFSQSQIFQVWYLIGRMFADILLHPFEALMELDCSSWLRYIEIGWWMPTARKGGLWYCWYQTHFTFSGGYGGTWTNFPLRY